jgi:hypothetical protein
MGIGLQCDNVAARQRRTELLGVVIIGARLSVKDADFPALARLRHSLIAGPFGIALFVADEGNGIMWLSLSFRVEKPQSRDVKQMDTAFVAGLRTLTCLYPKPWRRWLDVVTVGALG